MFSNGKLMNNASQTYLRKQHIIVPQNILDLDNIPKVSEKTKKMKLSVWGQVNFFTKTK